MKDFTCEGSGRVLSICSSKKILMNKSICPPTPSPTPDPFKKSEKKKKREKTWSSWSRSTPYLASLLDQEWISFENSPFEPDTTKLEVLSSLCSSLLDKSVVDPLDFEHQSVPGIDPWLYSAKVEQPKNKWMKVSSILE